MPEPTGRKGIPVADTRADFANRMKVWFAAALGLTPLATCPVKTGQVGVWNNSGTPKIRQAGGGDVTPGAQVITVPVLLSQAISGAIPVRIFPRYAGKVTAADLLSTQPPTTTSKGATLQIQISTVALSGGIFTCTSTGLATLGTRQAATTIVGSNAFSATQEIIVSVSAAAAAFAEGEALLSLVIGPPA